MTRAALAAARRATDTNPSRAQIEAGNYRKGKLRWNGVVISIENPKGSWRSGVGPDGKPWRTKLPADYGYILGTKGKDKDHIDVFIGPRLDAPMVYVVDQLDQRPDRFGAFDEHKVMIGFPSYQAALQAYRDAYEDGWAVGPITPMTVEAFKRWLTDADKRQPACTTKARLVLKARQLELPFGGPISQNPKNYLGVDRIGRRHWRASPEQPSLFDTARRGQAPEEPSGRAGQREADPRLSGRAMPPGPGVAPWQMLERDYVRSKWEAEVKAAASAASGWRRYIEENGGTVVAGPDGQPRVEWTDRTKMPSAARRREAETGLSYWTQRARELEARAEPDERRRQKWHEQYVQTVRKAISKGLPVPAEVIQQYPDLRKALDARQRYEKGWRTSFANRSAAINTTVQRERGIKVKRQDGKPITKAQIEEILTGLSEIEQVLGPLADVLLDADVTIAHTSGKHPFLTGYAGVFHANENTISIGLAGQSSFAHELGHWLDFEAGTRAGREMDLWIGSPRRMRKVHTTSLAEHDVRKEPDGTGASLIEIARRSMNGYYRLMQRQRGGPSGYMTQLRQRLGSYWHRPTEIWARLVEQYVATARRSGGVATESPDYYERTPGWWSARAFERLRPMVQQEIERRLAILRSTPKRTEKASALARAALWLLKAVREVRRPGLRGSTRWYWTSTGKLRYGTPPQGARPFQAAGVEQVAVLRTPGTFRGTRVRSGADIARIFREMVDADRERLFVVAMRKGGRVLGIELASVGSIAETVAVPRELLKNAWTIGAEELAIVHNHPSGNPVPSPEDAATTQRTAKVALHAGMRLRWHAVIGSEGYSILGPDGSVWENGRWEGADAKRSRRVPDLEGKLERSAPEQAAHPWIGAAVARPEDLAAIGRTLHDPGDRIAAVVALDHQNRVLGIWPFAHERLGEEEIKAALEVALHTSAAGLAVTGGQDGEEWQRDFLSAVRRLRRELYDAGVRVVDGVLVSSDRFTSAHELGWL